MKKNSKENKKDKNKNNIYKIKSDKLNNKLIEKDKKEVKTIEISVGFTVLKIIVIALIISLITALTAKTVMTKIRAKESTSETGNEGIASITEIDVQSTLSDDESETSETSGTAENGNTDDGIATIDDSSDYTITVTEYTGDTLEAEFDYLNWYMMIYTVDASTMEQTDALAYKIAYSSSEYYWDIIFSDEEAMELYHYGESASPYEIYEISLERMF